MEQANEGKLHWLSLSSIRGPGFDFSWKRIFQKVNGIVFLVVGDVSINKESYVVHSSISPQRFTGPIFEYAHKGRIYVRMFIEVSVRALQFYFKFVLEK
jgi:hypothetical protein